MNETYIQALESGCVVFHRNYRLYNNNKTIAFDNGAIRLITLDFECTLDNTDITVFFADDSKAKWTTKWISSYNFQFGLAVSSDGKYVFVQTWENGLFCLNSHTGEKIWRTKSKRGITSVFVNDNTLLCHQRERALQLLDIHTGVVLLEKRPATAWGFTSIDHNHIVCQVTARKWELIDTNAQMHWKQERLFLTGSFPAGTRIIVSTTLNWMDEKLLFEDSEMYGVIRERGFLIWNLNIGFRWT